MTTAATIITNALRLIGVIDQTEQPTSDDTANNVVILNDLLRSEHMDGCAQYLMKLAKATVPAGVVGQISSFSIGTGSGCLVQVDAVAVRAIYVNDVSPNLNRETRMAPKVDVLKTTYPGMITKWHQERQADGSVLITVWQPPRAAAPILIDYGARLAAITTADGSDTVGLPPEGTHDATLLLGRRLMGTYGRNPQMLPVFVSDSEAVNQRWRDWARGQQWLRFVRA